MYVISSKKKFSVIALLFLFWLNILRITLLTQFKCSITEQPAEENEAISDHQQTSHREKSPNKVIN